MTRYTTIGPVRLGCRHAHETVSAAERCRTRDERDCRIAGGYSDRRIYAYDADAYPAPPSRLRADQGDVQEVGA